MAETLDALVPGDSCRVTSLQLPPHKQRRMQELGLTVGSTVTALHRGPWGGIAAYGVLDTVVALRDCDALHITVA